LEPMPVHLSSSNEASFRCMTSLDSVREVFMQACIRNEDGLILCDSGPVSLRDDDWTCLSSCGTFGSGWPAYRLLCCMRDCENGWTLCFDVKERSDSTSLLTYVRAVRSCVRPASDEKPDDGGECALSDRSTEEPVSPAPE
ncbi:unnamed protein product, partial [Polarella glacialis]